MSTVGVAVDFIRSAHALQSSKVLVVGINGPQGLGKSWLAKNLCDALESSGTLRAVAILMDDFYVTHSEQQNINLRAQEAHNPLLLGRGLPGTHDIDLALQTIDSLVARKSSVRVPVYDKLAHGGVGDRSGWRSIEEPVDIVLFEGWFNGYTPLSSHELTQVYESSKLLQKYSIDSVREINDNLRPYTELWSRFDAFVILKTDSIQNVYLWREQQEQQLRKEAGQGMSEQAVVAFIDRYMPLYEMCYQKCLLLGAAPLDCVIKIDVDRKVVEHLAFKQHQAIPAGSPRLAGHI